MAKLRHFNRVVKQFAGLADFRIVYITEAHPADGWAFRNNYDVKNHRTLGDRMVAAQHLVAAKPECPVLVDDIDDAANRLYGGLYERLYVILDGRVVYAGARGPVGYDVKEVEDWLAAFRQSKTI